MHFNKQYILPIAALCLFSFSACQNTGGDDSTAEATISDTTAELGIRPVGSSPEYPDAVLKVKDIKSEVIGDSVKITFEYHVSNYTLKQQTADAEGKGCNNSKDGQHIHFILDNLPYQALYEPTHTFTVAKDSKHEVLSFLSRSYHESVKSKGAYELVSFRVDADGNVNRVENPGSPMVFYSRPKGDYLGADTENLLLDFYVLNATLGSDARVKATINGTDFTIDEWQAYFIENAPMGDLEVNLQLTDMNGQAILGKHTEVTRTSRLAQNEPMQ